MSTPTVTLIGCSGAIGAHVVDAFIEEGATVRVLARNPEPVLARHPNAGVVAGSMMEPDDVARAVEGADATFVLTPMGVRNDPSLEIAAGRAVAAGVARGEATHVVYNSVLGADRARGVAILDAKVEVEPALLDSGVPVSILRCGTFMEDIFDPRAAQIRKGRFLFPITRSRRFTYTCQRDVAPFTLEVLVGRGEVLGGPINFVSPGTYSLEEVEQVLSAAVGRPVKTAAKFPAYHLVQATRPYFQLRGQRFSSIVPLLAWFEANGYTDDGPIVGDRFPDFPMTTIEEHTRQLFAD